MKFISPAYTGPSPYEVPKARMHARYSPEFMANPRSQMLLQ